MGEEELMDEKKEIDEDELMRRHFAAVIKANRIGSELSQQELALRSSVNQKTISRLERKKNILTLPTLIKLAEGLDICPKQFSFELIDRFLQAKEQENDN